MQLSGAITTWVNHNKKKKMTNMAASVRLILRKHAKFLMSSVRAPELFLHSFCFFAVLSFLAFLLPLPISAFLWHFSLFLKLPLLIVVLLEIEEKNCTNHNVMNVCSLSLFLGYYQYGYIIDIFLLYHLLNAFFPTIQTSNFYWSLISNKST